MYENRALGRRLQEQRIRLGKTRKEMSEELGGVPVSTIRSWEEHNCTPHPTKHLLVRLGYKLTEKEFNDLYEISKTGRKVNRSRSSDQKKIKTSGYTSDIEEGLFSETLRTLLEEPQVFLLEY